MQSFCVILKPLSAFATQLKGDTLFGQLCWAIRNRFGEARLTELLAGYTGNRPFAVVSDVFPQGYLPLPKLPGSYYQSVENADRKAIKKLTWLPEAAVRQPLGQWLQHAVNPAGAASTIKPPEGAATVGATPTSRQKINSLSQQRPQPRNTINRQTNTTGEDGFAPYSIEQEWFVPGLRWDLYILLDTDRLSLEDCQQCLTDIGIFGFGKDASIGLGKFEVVDFQAKSLPAQSDANACLTLAPCAPQGLGFDSQNSFYQLFTRFGRHGDIAVHQEGKPFKNPLLLAQTAAVFTTNPPKSGVIGQGLGGNGELSKTLKTTVHQGYAPAIGIHLSMAGVSLPCGSDAHIATGR
jgi:CRISPR-associated protein Csm4